jgi:hypothetical protein
MKEALDNAITELKRVDHLFYVSLKYTRTADMMKHMVERLITTFSFGIDALLKQAKQEKKISEIPKNEGLKSKLAMQTFQNQELNEYINFYLKLREISRADYTKREEYRRHVTMTLTLGNGQVVEVNIDILKEYYDKAKQFVDFVKVMIYGEEEI